MESFMLEDAKNSFVEESTIDYINLHQLFIGAVHASDADPNADPMEQTLALVRWALARGFEVVDLIPEPPGHRPWPDQSPEAVIATIRDHWRATDEGTVGFDYWFHLPEARRRPPPP